MAKAKKVESNVSSGKASKREKYKRKSNKRVDRLGDQLKRLARKSMNRNGAKSFRKVALPK